MAGTLGLHLLELLLVMALLASSFGVGALILSRIPGERSPVEHLLFSTALGAGVLATLFLGMGYLRLLSAAPLWGAVLLAGASGWKELGRLPELCRGLARLLAGADPFPTAAAAAVLTLVAGILLVGALAPMTDWDSLMYHLEIPRQLLVAGHMHLPEDNLHLAYLGLVQMLYLPLLAAGGEAGPALLNGAFALFLGVAVLAGGGRFFARSAGAAGLILLWGSSSLILVAATPRIDVTLALFLFLAHYALLVSLESGEEWGLAVAALLGGMAVGVKYHALPYLAALAPVALWALSRTPFRSRGDAARFLLGCAALGAVAALPWLLKNWILLEGPVYPFFTERILPPWLAQLAGSHTHPPSVPLEIYRALGEAREPVTLRALLLSPADLTVEMEGRAFSSNPAFLLLPLSLLFLRSRAVSALLLPALGYLALLLAPFGITNLRYLIPALPALALATVEGVRRAGGWLGQKGRLSALAEERRRTHLLVAASLLALLPAAGAVRRELLAPARVSAALGALPAQDYLARAAVPGFPAYHAAVRWLNREAGPESRTLLLFEARGYYFRGEILQDNSLANWPLLLATGAPDRCLEGAGITHVLVNQGAAAYYRRRGADFRAHSWDRFPEFADRCLEMEYRGGGFEIYRVR